MNHIMIDIETMATTTDTLVLSLGAVRFNKNGVVDRFYTTFPLQEQLDKNRVISEDTLKWWMRQNKSAKIVFEENNTITLGEALDSFVEYVGEEEVYMWGNGSTFDVSIVEHLLQQNSKKIPWKYTNIRDFRTFKHYVYSGAEVILEGTAHNALDDSLHQATIVIKGMQKCGIN